MELIQKLKNYNFPKAVLKALKTLNQNGYEAFIVGGSIRDILLSKKVHDFDITTNGEPEEILKLFKKTIPTGLKHGTITAVIDNFDIEITTYRTDGEYLDFRHPKEVKFSKTIDSDLSRRDFTINALCYNPIDGKYIDLFGGFEDIKKGVIKAIGVAEDRFNEDALRMMRAIRFSSQLNFKIESETLKAIKKLYKNLEYVSMERKRDEFSKILETKKPSIGVELLKDTKILFLIIPEFEKTVGLEQNSYHKYDVYNHIVKALDYVKGDIVVKLATFFHDIGKVDTVEKGEIGNTFYSHEIVGKNLTKDILTNMRYPNNVIKNVSHLVENHMVRYDENWKDGAVRRFIKRVGVENIDKLYQIMRADYKAKKEDSFEKSGIDKLYQRVKKILEKDENLTISINSLKITGKDIMEYFNIPPSKKIGEMLKMALEYVIDQPDRNKKGELLLFLEKNINK